MKNVVTIPSNEILENASYLNGMSMKDMIKNNILSDYQKGVRRASVTIIPKDYLSANFYQEGEGITFVNWSNGEILKIDDIICLFDKNNDFQFKDKNNNIIYFRVVDRKVRYEGQIFIDIVLEEIVPFVN